MSVLPLRDLAQNSHRAEHDIFFCKCLRILVEKIKPVSLITRKNKFAEPVVYNKLNNKKTKHLKQVKKERKARK